MIRWILSNPVYDPRFLILKNKIRQVIAMAPSSGGTILADEVFNGGAFEASLGWLLGYITDAVNQQRVGNMLIYNEELLFGTKNRPDLPLPFRVIVGTDALAGPLSKSSYCNGYILNAGLKIVKMYLNHCADGFLNCSSQTAAGQVCFMISIKQTTTIP